MGQECSTCCDINVTPEVYSDDSNASTKPKITIQPPMIDENLDKDEEEEDPAFSVVKGTLVT